MTILLPLQDADERCCARAGAWRASSTGAASRSRSGGCRGASPTAKRCEELTGQDRVPLLVIGREAICDSHRIVEHLRWLDEQ